MPVLNDGPLMRAVCQRVSRGRVTVAGDAVAAIERGLVVLLGVARSDTDASAERLAGKVARLRIFEDDEGKFALSLLDVGWGALVVSQFTLIADTAKGNRPSFSRLPPRARRNHSTNASAPSSGRSASRSRRASSGPAWRSSSSTTAR